MEVSASPGLTLPSGAGEAGEPRGRGRDERAGGSRRRPNRRVAERGVPEADTGVRWRPLQVGRGFEESGTMEIKKGGLTFGQPPVQAGACGGPLAWKRLRVRVVGSEERISQEENRRHSEPGEACTGTFLEEGTDLASPNGSRKTGGLDGRELFSEHCDRGRVQRAPEMRQVRVQLKACLYARTTGTRGANARGVGRAGA